MAVATVGKRRDQGFSCAESCDHCTGGGMGEKSRAHYQSIESVPLHFQDHLSNLQSLNQSEEPCTCPHIYFKKKNQGPRKKKNKKTTTTTNPSKFSYLLVKVPCGSPHTFCMTLKSACNLRGTIILPVFFTRCYF